MAPPRDEDDDEDRNHPSWLREEDKVSRPKPKPTERTQLVAATDGGAASSNDADVPDVGEEVINGLADAEGSKHIERGWPLNAFILVSNLTVASALSVAAAQVLNLTAFFSATTRDVGMLTIQQFSMRVYGLVFCAGIVFVEMEWVKALREIALVQNWISRGLFYIFVGLLAYEEQYEANTHRWQSTAVFTYIETAASVMCWMGVTYSVMGIFCLKKIRDRKMARYRTALLQAEVREAFRDGGAVMDI